MPSDQAKRQLPQLCHVQKLLGSESSWEALGKLFGAFKSFSKDFDLFEDRKDNFKTVDWIIIFALADAVALNFKPFKVLFIYENIENWSGTSS